MALQGTIDSFPLDDVLGFLAGTGRSGVLRVEGDRGTVRLWIADGSIVGAESAGSAVADPVQVVFEALRFGAGSFAFDDDGTGPVERLEPRSIGTVVQEAAARRDEWDAIEAVLPSPAHSLRTVVPLPHDHVTLDASSWRIVTALGRTDTVASVLARSGLSELDAARGLVALVRQGLIEVGDPTAPSAGETVVVDRVDVHPPQAGSERDERQGPDRVDGTGPVEELVRLDLGDLDRAAERLRAELPVDDDVAARTDDRVPTGDRFPIDDGVSVDDRFPIDDLIGVDAADDPWSTVDRVAQPFATTGGSTDESGDESGRVAEGVGSAPGTVTGGFVAGTVTGGFVADEAPVDDAADPVLEQATWMSQGAADAIAEVLGAPGLPGGGRTYEGGDPAFR